MYSDAPSFIMFIVVLVMVFGPYLLSRATDLQPFASYLSWLRLSNRLRQAIFLVCLLDIIIILLPSLGVSLSQSQSIKLAVVAALWIGTGFYHFGRQ